MLARGLVAGLNHVLKGESWARERLSGFAGRHIRLQAVSILQLDLSIDGKGYFHASPAPAGEAPDVTIELPADAPFRFLADRQSLLAAARLSGAADLVETLAFVFRNLRWDVEEDLAGLVGDVAAHRLVRAGGAFMAWQKVSAGNLAANVAEYLSEESDVLVPGREIRGFSAEVKALDESLAGLERRLARLT